MNELAVRTRTELRRWLKKNHASTGEVWLIFHRKATGEPCIPYDDAVEEALCFGWIDSIIRKIDERRYARKFTPRKAGSAWSESNKARAMRMIAEDLMTPAGMVLIDGARKSGEWKAKRKKPVVDTAVLPAELASTLALNGRARKAFDSLPPSHKKRYVLWIAMAKKPETRQRRAREAATMLERGEYLGLK